MCLLKLLLFVYFVRIFAILFYFIAYNVMANKVVYITNYLYI